MYHERFAHDPDEEARLKALHALELLDTPPERAFEALAALASRALGCPIGMVTLIDRTRQWIKASIGTDLRQTDRDAAFCNHTIRTPGMMIVPDAALDERFAASPLVTGDPHVRFYAGMPLRATDPESGVQQRIGAICAVDTVPRSLTADQMTALEQLAVLAEAILGARAMSGESLKIAAVAHAQAEALQRSITRFRQAERIAAIGSWSVDLRDRSVTWSEGVYRIHELPPGESVDLEKALSFFPPRTRNEISGNFAATERTGQPIDFETDIVTAAGNLRRVRSLGELDQVDGAQASISGIFQDVTDRYRLEQSLRRLAEVDEVSGIANRAAFNRALEAAMTAAIRTQRPLLLVLIDLDHFKQVNDGHGHAAGDAVLRVVGERLRSFCGTGCFAARLGGDEFALIVQDGERCDGAEAFMAELMETLMRPAATDYGRLPVSATIGYGLFENALDANLREFVHRIDSALYDAKRARRGSARRYTAQGRRSADHAAD